MISTCDFQGTKSGFGKSTFGYSIFFRGLHYTSYLQWLNPSRRREREIKQELGTTMDIICGFLNWNTHGPLRHYIPNIVTWARRIAIVLSEFGKTGTPCFICYFVERFSANLRTIQSTQLCFPFELLGTSRLFWISTANLKINLISLRFRVNSVIDFWKFGSQRSRVDNRVSKIRLFPLRVVFIW